MTKGPELDDRVTADAGGISVEKSFVPDEFPVPAIRFRIEAPADEAASIRLVDSIPESFPMDRVGFHPDYENDNWTAYKDHRVEFTRELAAGEEVTTVYGIRTDDPEDAEAFLVEPTVERTDAGGAGVAAAEDVEEVIGDDGADSVREVVADEDATLSGLEEAKEERAAKETEVEAATDIDLDEEAPEQVESDPTLEESADGPSTEEWAEGEPTPEEPADGPSTEEGVGGEPAPEVTPEESTEGPSTEEWAETEPTPAEPADGLSTEERPDPTPQQGIAGQLADEIRAGEVDDDDLDLLREELDFATPRSVDVRIARLQSQVSDLEAYSDALEQFIDEEGSAQEIVENFEAELEEVTATVDELDARVDDAGTERAELGADLDAVADDVAAVEERVEDAHADITAVESRVVELSDELDDTRTTVENLDEDLSWVTDDVEAHDEELDEIATDLEDAESQLASVSGRVNNVMGRVTSLENAQDEVEGLGERADEIEASLAEVQDELEEIQEFRERINQAFGPGE